MRETGMRIRLLAPAVLASLLLAGCGVPTQNRYSYQDVGKLTPVEFGTVLAKREIRIQGENTGVGALLGGGTQSMVGAQFGEGAGSVASSLSGAVTGIASGSLTEQLLANRDGLEYLITLSSGKTVTVVQNIDDDDRPIEVGDRVMVQTSGHYQRVLPAKDLPETVVKPKGIELGEAPASAPAAPPPAEPSSPPAPG
ncbi:MAG: hypothetical protein RLZZ501_51 [Pseudomonadota bacterium]|jgi:outer membrane lipoprotein SlyB